jgi:hypothetical protein
MEIYDISVKLELKKKIGVTDEVYEILKSLKKESKINKTKISMAKLVCNAIIEKYGTTR